MMKKQMWGWIFLLILCGIGPLHAAPTRNDTDVRQPVVAGRFYPADPARLSRAVENYMRDAVAPCKERPVAIIAPHAGYIYSGQICADAFNQAAGHDYGLIVLLGTSHTAAGSGKISVWPRAGYRTPLGVAAVDENAASRLMASDRAIGFYPAAHQQEHSIEVLVPFVQTLFPGVNILPVLVGARDAATCVRFGQKLAEVLKGRRALMVASSDLSHYPGYEEARKTDQDTLEAIISLDPMKFSAVIREQERQSVPNLSTCACGASPIMAAMTAAKLSGANCGRIISYANSGDASVGDRSRVVGYGAVAFVRTDRCNGSDARIICPSSADSPLSLSRKRTLIGFARKTIASYLSSETAPLLRSADPALCARQGAFVTLRKHGHLRGCIGHMAEDRPLCQVVGAMALQAAFNDRRFPPLTASELTDTEIEISVLTPFREVADADEIVVGRDGVLIRKADRSAVYLPQVAPEQGWNRTEMLSNLCRKAGLAPDAWKEETRFYTFQATVFSESDVE